MKESSTRQSRGPKRWFINKSDDPEIQLERTSIAETSDKEKSQNILDKNYCLRIKCTIANSLAALM